jgi:hypothetical protein
MDFRNDVHSLALAATNLSITPKKSRTEKVRL